MLKMIPAAALALFATVPAFAQSAPYVLDFEHDWQYNNSAVNEFYNGGLASDGASGSNYGVSLTGFYGLSNNDGLGQFSGGAYYTNAPTALGVAYVDFSAPAIMNVAAGATSLSMFYSTAAAVTGAVRAFSGLNGSGVLLGTLDVAASTTALNPDAYTSWNLANFAFTGTAKSFDFTGSAGMGLDNIGVTPVPEPANVALMLAGLVSMGLLLRRRA